MTVETVRRWRRVTPRERCPVCGRETWCEIREDGVIHCMRVRSNLPIKGRLGGWLHMATLEPAPRRTAVPAAATIVANVGLRHDVYSWLLARLTLSKAHLAHLLSSKRGMSEEQVKARGYKTWPDARRRWGLAKEVAERFGDVMAVPGFVLQKGQYGEYVSLNGPEGLAIPVRDAEGRIVALRLRLDQAKRKYVWLSGDKKGGATPGAVVHVSRPTVCEARPWRVWLTEGELKADIASDILGEVVVSVPGVTAWKPLPLRVLLTDLGAVEVVVAFDVDLLKNIYVARAYMEIVQALKEGCLTVSTAWWEPKAGKGLDDMLLAGVEPEVVPTR